MDPETQPTSPVTSVDEAPTVAPPTAVATPSDIAAKKQKMMSAAAGAQSAISSPMAAGIANPNAPKETSPFDVIFGHASNPAPSSGIPDFAPPPMQLPPPVSPIQSPGAAQLAPVAMAPQAAMTPPVNLGAMSDRTVKKNIIPAERSLNDFFTQLYSRKR